MSKARFPGLERCLEMMRDRDALTQEEGFHWLMPHAQDNLERLMMEFECEKDRGMKSWLLELIAGCNDPRSFELLMRNLSPTDSTLRMWAIHGLKNLNTREAWQALQDIERD